MNIYLIEFNEVDWEEDYSILVSARNEEEAYIVANITKVKTGDNKFEANVESVKYIGKYYIDKAEIIMYSNKGA